MPTTPLEVYRKNGMVSRLTNDSAKLVEAPVREEIFDPESTNAGNGNGRQNDNKVHHEVGLCTIQEDGLSC